jgi:hypothetical protein
MNEAINVMTFGIVILFIMVSVWGFINAIRGTLEITRTELKDGSEKSVRSLIKS